MHRVLLSGPGLIGLKHADLVASSSNSELVGVVAPSSPTNLEFADKHNIPLYENFESGLLNTRPSAVIVSSPNKEHFGQAKISLELGIPTLVEKPVTHDLDTAKKLVKVTEATGIPLLVGHHRTHSPLISIAKSFLDAREFGDLVALQGSALFLKPANYFEAAPWRTKLGGGPLLINLIHEIGLWRTFGGEIETISAIVSNRRRKFEVEDSASISMQFTNDALGSFILSDAAASAKSWELTAAENLAFPHNPYAAAYHFAGTRGSLDFPTMRTSFYIGEPSWLKPFDEGQLEIERQDPLKLQLEHFLRVASGIEKPLVTAVDGYKNLLILGAIVHSNKMGEKVDLTEFEESHASQ